MDNVIEITKAPDGRRFVKLPEKVTRAKSSKTALPDDPRRVNAIALVVCYDLYGLSSSDCAYTVGLSEGQLDEIRGTSIYNALRERIIDNLGATGDTEVKAIFVAAAKKAAEKIVEQLDSNSSAQAISAAMKILEGAGMSPRKASVVQDKMAAGLSIVFMDAPDPKVVDHGA